MQFPRRLFLGCLPSVFGVAAGITVAATPANSQCLNYMITSSGEEKCLDSNGASSNSILSPSPSLTTPTAPQGFTFIGENRAEDQYFGRITRRSSNGRQVRVQVLMERKHRISGKSNRQRTYYTADCKRFELVLDGQRVPVGDGTIGEAIFNLACQPQQ
ncbi:hypothetical protein IQ250_01115 [Pseudanabaenaceae cyanobacterium LEGE 13415]|nr:hypothetical protein [Pseudanabaenaceae cyanobacterium LEGE 13415]